jgi:uncharacterized protein YegP (UPF0339 family)
MIRVLPPPPINQGGIMPKIHIWQNPRTKQWYYTFVAHNGNKITSTEGYHRNAIRAVGIQSDYFYLMAWSEVSSRIIYSKPKPSPRRKRKATVKPR